MTPDSSQLRELLDALLTEKEKTVEELKKQQAKLLEDFNYNLGLLEARDAELSKYDQAFVELKSVVHLKEVEVSELRVELAETETKLKHEVLRCRDETSVLSHKLEDAREQITTLKWTKDEELRRMRDECDGARREYIKQLREKEQQMEDQRRELSTAFDEAIRKRDFEFTKREEDLNELLRERELKVKQVLRELDSRDAKMKELYSALDTTTQSHHELERKVKALQTECEQLRQEKSTYTISNEEERRQLLTVQRSMIDEYENRIAELTKNLQQTEMNATQTKERLEADLRSTVLLSTDKLQAAEKRFEMQLLSKDSALDLIQGELLALKSSLHKERERHIDSERDQKQFIDELEDKLRKEKSRAEREAAEVKNLREEVHLTRRLLAERENDLKRKMQELESEMKRELNKQHGRYEKTLAEERSRFKLELDRLTNQLHESTMESRTADLERDLQRSESQVQLLDSQLKESRRREAEAAKKEQEISRNEREMVEAKLQAEMRLQEADRRITVLTAELQRSQNTIREMKMSHVNRITPHPRAEPTQGLTVQTHEDDLNASGDFSAVFSEDMGYASLPATYTGTPQNLRLNPTVRGQSPSIHMKRSASPGRDHLTTDSGVVNQLRTKILDLENENSALHQKGLDLEETNVRLKDLISEMRHEIENLQRDIEQRQHTAHQPPKRFFEREDNGANGSRELEALKADLQTKDAMLAEREKECTELQGRVQQQVLEIRNLTEERDKLMEISNMLKAELQETVRDSYMQPFESDDEGEFPAVPDSIEFERTEVETPSRVSTESVLPAHRSRPPGHRRSRTRTSASSGDEGMSRLPASGSDVQFEYEPIEMSGRQPPLAERLVKTPHNSDRITLSQLRVSARLRAARSKREEHANMRRQVRNYNIKDDSEPESTARPTDHPSRR